MSPPEGPVLQEISGKITFFHVFVRCGFLCFYHTFSLIFIYILDNVEAKTEKFSKSSSKVLSIDS